MTDVTAADYRVLARKYRPRSFAELIGQEALVRTFTNAFSSGRLAHAFILTGVRGVGKTTTARIIARALNCVGPDGQGGPTAEPCGACEPCVAITEDRHVDVLEMDAASRTGVADIREIIEGVRYMPAAARYKVYIIDEVHMLSNQAFNALLKTLEEPPPHVKFVFATTEIRKVPVTVLSRCQRFDLRRVGVDDLLHHLEAVAGKEGVSVEPAALRLIVRAAEGSVRDGLSLLDQAIAYAEGAVTEAEVGDILGLADRERVFDLLDRVMAGDVAGALGLLREMYDDGADPLVVMQDLLDFTHWLTRLKVVPDAGADIAVTEVEQQRGHAMADQLTLPVLARTWQMLLKGLGEARVAAAPLAAVEMVLVRLGYAADLPAPAELVRAIETGVPPRRAPVAAAPAPGAPVVAVASGGAKPAPEPADEAPPADDRTRPPEARRADGSETAPAPRARDDFAAVVAQFAERREAILHTHLINDVHLVRFENGRIEIRLDDKAPQDLANRLGACLSEWTGERWMVSVSNEEGGPTLAEQAARKAADERAAVAEHPLVKATLEAFPTGEIRAVRRRPAVVAESALPPEGAVGYDPRDDDGEGVSAADGDEEP